MAWIRIFQSERLQPLRPLMHILWWRYGLFMALMALTAGLSLVDPLILRYAIDEVILPKQMHLLWWVVLASLGLPIVGGILFVVQTYFHTRVGEEVVLHLRARILRRVLSQDLRLHVQTNTGELVSRVTNDVNLFAGFLTNHFPNLLLGSLRMVIVGAIMLWMDWRLALVVLLLIPLFVKTTKGFAGKIEQAVAERQSSFARLQGFLQDVLAHVQLVQLFMRIPMEIARHRFVSRDLVKAQVRQRVMWELFENTLNVIGAVAPAGILGYGGYLVIQGNLSLGSLTAFVSYSVRLLMPIVSLSHHYNNARSSLAVGSKVLDLMTTSPSVRSGPKLSLDGIRGAVVMKAVGFRYVKRNVLENIHLEGYPGERIAIVGPSGSGKSTLAYLLCRLYDPNEGCILLDGVDMRRWTLRDVRANIALVPQESNLLNRSILDNLRYASPQADMEAVVRAAKKAYIHDFIESLPSGYDTIVGNQGMALSAGQRQRIAIARAFLHNPAVLILDEVTSALDAESEAFVRRSLQDLAEGRTLFVIAHRLSTVADVARIYVLSAGRIVQCGTHKELLDAGGVYADLYHAMEEAPEGGSVGW